MTTVTAPNRRDFADSITHKILFTDLSSTGQKSPLDAFRQLAPIKGVNPVFDDLSESFSKILLHKGACLLREACLQGQIWSELRGT